MLVLGSQKCRPKTLTHWAQMRESMSSKRDEIVSERFGEQTPMRVKFREVDPFSLWVGTHNICKLSLTP